MIKRILYSLLIFLIFGLTSVVAQITSCNPDDVRDELTDNLITDPDFDSGGFSNFNYDATLYTEGFDGNTHSDPGEIFITSDASTLNGAFLPWKGYGGSGNFYMIDGATTLPNMFWEQDVYIENNHWYIFEIYVMTVFDNTPSDTSDLANFQFVVDDGVTTFTFPNEFKTPTTVGEWQVYVDSVYYTGSTGTFPLQIWNTEGGNFLNGNDFAIDHMQFRQGCAFAIDETPVPTLQDEITLCGTTGVVSIQDFGLDCFDSNLEFLWSNGSTTCATTVSVGQTLALCVQKNGGCIKSDLALVVTDYEVDLGPDLLLCDPLETDLVARLSGDHTGEFVTYRWFKDGGEIGGETDSILTVNTPGEYVVETFDSICDVKRDTVIVESTLGTPVNDTICTDTESTASISVLGYDDPTQVNWYTTATGGSLIASNTSVYNPTGITSDTVFYAEYIGRIEKELGPRLSNPTTSHSGSSGSGGAGIAFTTTVPNMRIDSVTVYAYNAWQSPLNLTVDVYDIVSGTVIGTTPIRSLVGTTNVTKHRIPIKITIPNAGSYALRVASSNGNLLQWDTFNFPYSEGTGAITLDFSRKNDGTADNGRYNFFYDWYVSYPNNCARVPVYVVDQCPCIGEPTTVSVSPANPSVCIDDSVKFTATSDQTGAGYVWQWYKNGIALNYWDSGLDSIYATSAGVYTARHAIRGEYNCSAEGNGTVSVPPLSIDLGDDVELCTPASITLNAGAGFTTYTWYKDNVVYPYSDSYQLFVNEAGTYHVVVSSVCDTLSDTIDVTLNSSALVPGNITVCPLSDGNNDTLTVSGSTAYEWYTDSIGGVPITQAVDNMYITDIISDPTVYWVEDISSTTVTTGPTPTALENYYSGNINNFHRSFEALTNFTLNSVFIVPVANSGGPCGGSGTASNRTITVTLYKNNVATAQTASQLLTCGTGSTMNLNFNITTGTGYELRIDAGSIAFNWYHVNSSNGAITVPGVINILANPGKSGSFFNWNITASSACGRTPVVAVESCPCTPPTTATLTNGTVCSPDSVKFKVTTDAPADYVYTWFTGASVITGPTINLDSIYRSTNTSDIKVRIADPLDPTNPNCYLESNLVSATIIAAPTVEAGSIGDACENGSAIISGASVSNNASYTWSHDGSGSLTNTNTLTPTYTPVAGDAGNTVTITLESVGNAPCANVEDDATLDIIAAPTVEAGSIGNACENGSAIISGASVSNNASYTWSHNGSGSLSNGNTLTPTYTPVAADAGNTVTITLESVGNTPCSNVTDDATLDIIAAPTVEAGSIGDACENGSATISGASVSNNASYTWSHDGSGSLSNDNTLTPTYTPVAADAGNTVTITLESVGNTPCNNVTDDATLDIIAAPTVEAGSLADACENGSATISGASVSNNASYTWSHDGSGSLSNGNTLTPTYTPVAADAGNTVTITLESVGNTPCSNVTDDATLDIIAAPTVEAGSIGDACENGSAIISGASVSNNASYTWSHDGSGSLSNDNTLTPTYTPVAADAGNTVTITLESVGNTPCSNVTDDATLDIIAAPTVEAGSIGDACENGSAIISGASVSNNASYTWSHDGSGSLSNDNTLTPTYTPVAADAGNTVTITLESVGNTPCSNVTDDATLDIIAAPTVEAGSIGDACENGSAIISGASVSNNASYTWSHNGSGSLSNGNTLTPTYTPVAADAGNTVTITLESVGNTPCSNVTDDATLDIIAAPTVEAGSLADACENGSATISGASVSNNASYTWSHDGSGSLSNGNTLTPTYTPVAADAGNTVTITLESVGNTPCSNVTDDATLDIIAAPTVEAGSIGDACENGSAIISGASVSNNASYTWSHDGSGSLSNDNTLTPTYTPVAADAGNTVTITLESVGNTPCSNVTDDATLDIIAAPTVEAGSIGDACENGSAIISGASVSNNASYTWSHDGSGSLSNDNTLTPTYTPVAADAGNTVTITLESVGNTPCSNVTDDATLDIIAAPTVEAGSIGDACENGSAIISGASVSNNASYTWSHNGSGSLSNDNTLTPTYTPVAADAGNTVTITLESVGNTPCSNVTDDATLDIIAAPTVEAGSLADACENGSAIISGASVSNNASYTWSHDGAGSLSNDNTLTPTYTPVAADAGNTVTITLESVGNTPCSNVTDDATLDIIAAPTVEAGSIGDACENGSAIISGASVSNNASYTWSHNGSGSLSNDNTLTPTYTPVAADAGNTVTITLESVGNTPCSNVTDDATLDIIAAPTVEAGSIGDACENGSAIISGASVSNNASYTWSHNGSGSLSNDNTLTPTYTPVAADAGNTVTITLESVGNTPCSNVTDDATLDIIAAPTVEAGSIGDACENGSAIISGASVSNNASYTWSHNGSGSLSNDNTLTPTYTPVAADAGNTITITLESVGNTPCSNVTDDATLDIIATVTNTVDTTVCFGATYDTPQGTTIDPSGGFATLDETVTTVAGCDSIITYNVTEAPAITNTVAETVCYNGSFTYADGTVSTNVVADESHVSTLTAANGCDSVVTQNVTVDPVITNTVNVSICTGASFTTPEGTLQNGAGSVVETVSTTSGCDSVITYNVTETPAITHTVDTTVCFGATYDTPQGTTIDPSGGFATLDETVTTVAGCDSIITYNVTEAPAITNTVAETVCYNGSFTYADGTVSTNVVADESHVSTLTAANGCDSVVTQNVTVDPVITHTVNVSICTGASFTTPEGTLQNGAGSVVETVSTASGCDSVITYNVTETPAITHTVDTTVCFGATYDTPQGTTIDPSGGFATLDETVTTVAGCDSIITYNVTEAPAITNTVAETVCYNGSFTYADGTVSTNVVADESHVSTLTAANGCDSVVTQNVTVDPVITNTVNVSICTGASFTTPEGTLQNGAGSVVETVSTTSGCDSVITYNVTETPAITHTVDTTVCFGATYDTPQGTTIDPSGGFATLDETVTTVAGCDSIITYNVTEAPAITNTVAETVCYNGSFTYADGTVSTNVVADESHVSTLTAANGCDSVVTQNVTVDPVITNTVNVSICTGASFTTPEGTLQNGAGSVVETVSTTSGCDSVITYNVTETPAITHTVDTTVCFGATYDTPQGTTIDPSGGFATLDETVTTVAGCDSIITYNVTEAPAITNTVAETVCYNGSFTYADGTVSTNVVADESHVSTLTAANGCDSVVTQNVTVDPVITNTVNVSICTGASFTTPEGTLQNGAGSVVETVSTASGCDSVITYNVTETPAITHTVDTTVCFGATYDTPQGTTIDPSGGFATLDETVTTVAGCDSIITYNVTEAPAITNTVAETVCYNGSFTYADGTVSTNVVADESHVSTLTAANGCDSVVTQNVTVDPVITNTVNVSICTGASFTTPEGTLQNGAGSVVETVSTASGCDSVITYNVTETPAITHTVDTTVCFGATYDTPQGTTIDPSGGFATLDETVTTVAGCDSIITYNVTEAPAITNTVAETVCYNGSFTYADGTVSTNVVADESHVSTLTAANGCDSVVTQNVTVDPVITNTVNVSICTGASFTTPEGTLQNGAGSVVETVSTTSGCDSVITYNVTETPAITHTVDTTVCFGATYDTPQGTTIDPSGGFATLDETVTTVAGCDSIITYNVTEAPAITNTVAETVCYNGSFTYADGTVSTNVVADESHVSTLTAANGCDSVVTQNVTVDPVITHTVNVSICTGASFTTPEGTLQNGAGSVVETVSTTSGCDSVITYNVTETPAITHTVDTTVCFGATYDTPQGTTIDPSGGFATLDETVTTVAGCDSIITYNVTEAPAITNTVAETVCYNGSFTYADGTVSTNVVADESHVSTLTAANGCDSVVTQNVTVDPVITNTVNVSICTGASFTTPEGTLQNGAGSVVETVSTTSGCDSVITYNVTETPAITHTVDTTVCFGATYDTPQGTTIDPSGGFATLDETVTTVAGCDSIITYNVTEAPAITNTVAETVCYNGSFTYADGTVSTNVVADESHVSTLTAANGCDSVVTQNVTVDPVITHTVNVSICTGASFTTPEGTLQNGAGSVVETVSTTSGCDSVITYNVTETPAITHTVDTTVCFGATYDTPQGTTIDPSGGFATLDETVTTVAGCDSIITYNVTEAPAITNTVAETVCYNGSFTYADGTVSTNVVADESHVSTLTAANGCDSVVTQNVTVDPVITNTVNVSICTGASFTTPEGTLQNGAGSVVETVSTASGCDSVITYNVTETPAITHTVDTTVCFGATYDTPQGTTIDPSGGFATLDETVTTVAGCDSIITYNVTEAPAITNTVNISICSGGSFTTPEGTVQNGAGNVVETVARVGGCDSVITYVVTEIPTPVITSLVDQVGCVSYTLPAITGADITAGADYYFDPSGMNPVVGAITTTDTIYVYDQTGTTPNCVDEDTVIITIDPQPVANTVNGGSICPGDSIKIGLTFTGDTIRWESSPTGTNIWTSLSTTNTDSIYVSPLVDSDYRAIVAYSASSCQEDTSILGTVTINPDAVGGNVVGIDTLCTGDTTIISLSNSVGIIQWQDSIVGGTWVNIGVASVDTFVQISPDTSNPNHFYRAIVGNGSCIDTSDIHPLFVKNCCTKPTIADISPDSVIICGLANDTLVTVTTDAPVGYLYTWFSVSDTNNALAGPAVDLTSYRVTVTDTVFVKIQMPGVPGCDLKSDSSIVDIRPDVVAGIVTVSPTPVCDGESTTITLAGHTGTFAWQLNDGTGWRDTSIATVSWSHLPRLPIDTVSYRAIVTNSGICVDTTDSDTLTIVSQPIAGVVSVEDSICENESVTVSTIGSFGGVIWEDSIAGSGTWNRTPLRTGITETYPTSGTTTRYFRVIAGSGQCADTSNIDSLIINPRSEGGMAVVTNPVCHGDSANLTLSGYTASTIQWQDSSRATAGLWTDIAYTADDVWVSYPDSLSPVSFRAIVTNNPGGCLDTSSITTLQIDSLAIGGVVSIDDSICSGEGATVSIAGHRGAIQWQVSSASNQVWRDTLTGQVSENILPTEASDTLFYRAILNYQGNGCLDTSSIDTLIVHPAAIPGTPMVDDPAICEGESTVVRLQGYDGIKIQWQDSTATDGWKNIVGETADTLVVSPTLAISPQRVRALVTNRGECLDSSTVAEISSSSQAVAGELTSVPDSICEGSTGLLITTGHEGLVQWQEETSPGTFTDATVPEYGVVNNDTLIIPNTKLEGIYNYRVVYGVGECKDTSDVEDIKVVEDALAGTAEVDPLIICEGETAEVILTGYLGNIVWEDSSATKSWSVSTNVDVNNDTMTVQPTANESPLFYRAVVTNSNICSYTSAPTRLEVVPHVIGGVADAVNDTICNGSSDEILLTGSYGTITWETSADGLVWDTIIPIETDTNMTVSPGTGVGQVSNKFYRAILDNGVCTDTSTIADVTTYPDVDLMVSLTGPTRICQNDEAVFNVKDSLGGGQNPTFKWYVQNVEVNSIKVTNAGTRFSDTTLTNNAVIKVEMYSDSLCAVNPVDSTLIIQVDPLLIPEIYISVDDSIKCQDELFTFTIDSTKNLGLNPTYQWYLNNQPIPTATNPLAYESSTLVLDDIIKVQVTQSPEVCTQNPIGYSNPIKLDVHEKPMVGNLLRNKKVCYGGVADIELSSYKGVIEWQYALEGDPADVWTTLKVKATSNEATESVAPHLLYSTDSILELRSTKFRAVVYEDDYESHECDSIPSNEVMIHEIPLPYGEIIAIDTTCANYIALIEPRVYNNTYTGFTGWYQSFDGKNYRSYNSQFVEANDNILLTDTNVKAQFFIAEFKTDAPGCVLRDTIAIRDCAPPKIDIPNAMTPNGDNTNNTFWIRNIWFYPENTLRIYNRWGSLVFEADGYNNEWYGQRDGKDMPAAVYYYVLELNDKDGNYPDPFTGTVTIFR